MKIKLLSILLGLLILASGCKKKESNINSEGNELGIVSKLKINSLQENSNMLATMNMKDERSRKLSFVNFLSSGEKANLMRIRLNGLINEMNLNERQISIVKEVSPYLREDLFEGNTVLKADFLLFEREWLKRALQQFSKNELAFMFSSLMTFSEFKTNNVSNDKVVNGDDETEDTIDSGDKKTCKCNTSSDWCDDRDGPCTTTDKCGSTAESGCGTLWAHPCNGWCKLLIPLI